MYALERSTEEIAFDPPKAKKVIYCSIRVVIVTSTPVRFSDERILDWSRNIRKVGIFVALDCVIRKRWIVSWKRIFDTMLLSV